METKNDGTRARAIEDFWKWFIANNAKLVSLYQAEQFDELGRQITSQLDKVEPQLGWEMGPGKKESRLLTISGEGDPDLRELADLAIQSAPSIDGWEFYSARPSRPAPAIVELPESGESFKTIQWEFIPVERPELGRVDLVVMNDQLAQSDRETALRAVSIYLDEILGEDTVERWIGSFEVKDDRTADGKNTHKMSELPDYLEWATNRKQNPLVKRDIQ